MAYSSLSLEIARVGISRGFSQRPCHFLPSIPANPKLRRKFVATSAMAIHSATPQASTISPAKIDSPASFSGRGRDSRGRISPQKLDEWMQDSIGEIVRNVGKTPFLLQIFSGERDEMEGGHESRRICSSSSTLILHSESATIENWPCIKKRWEQECCVPDGIILVEELSEEEGKKDVHESWGVVIQGRGMDFSACYILSTCKVRSSVGFCTHFCLVRAKCFGGSVGMQLKNVWLTPER